MYQIYQLWRTGLLCLFFLDQITRGKMIRKHNFSLHTWRGWKMNSATADRSNWWVSRGKQLEPGWAMATSWHAVNHLQKIGATAAAAKKKRPPNLKRWGGKGEREREEHAADICASNYLKTLPNAFWHYIISWWGEHKVNHSPRWLPRRWLQHPLSHRYKNTAISCICGW